MLNLFTALAIGLMFALGVFQIMRRNLIRVAIGLIILTNAVNMFLLTSGAYDGLVAAYYGSQGQISDPLPQALVLTAIVIGAGFFAFSLALLYVIGFRYKTSDSDRVEGLRY
ncbi:MAG: sodium:proton antiporter [Desulfitobacteriaceae bacterium]|nr:sodium:proton antiporter [Desulfitobacteriaceae bacterium]